jgi:hypothetical protein
MGKGLPEARQIFIIPQRWSFAGSEIPALETRLHFHELCVEEFHLFAAVQ